MTARMKPYLIDRPPSNSIRTGAPPPIEQTPRIRSGNKTARSFAGYYRRGAAQSQSITITINQSQSINHNRVAQITLKEALLGFSKIVPHPNGRSMLRRNEVRASYQGLDRAHKMVRRRTLLCCALCDGRTAANGLQHSTDAQVI